MEYNMETIDKIRKQLQKIGLYEMQRRLGEEFYQMEDVVASIYTSIVSGKNLILYGLGGFGKTQIVKRFLQIASIPQATIVGYEDMDVEALLGIPNMKMLMEESKYQISFETTAFMTKGVMVLEEFLDVNPKTAIALKDIITEGGYRQGDSFIKSNISSFIVCTNKSPDEMNIDNSTTAFYHERFPIKKYVGWKHYNYDRYSDFIKLIVGKTEYQKNEESYQILAELSSRTSATSRPVSPRIVIDAIDIMKHNEYDVESLIYLDGINTDILPQVREVCRVRDESHRIRNIESNISQVVSKMLSDHSIEDTTINISKLSYIKKKLLEYPVISEKGVEVINQLKDMCERSQTALWTYFDSVSKIDKKKIDELFE
jgi:hypothetical protein